MGAEIITIAAGDLLLGARANDAEADRWLRELLAPGVVVADATPPPNVSIAMGERETVGKGLHLLYRGLSREVRTTSLGRILRAVPAQLDGWLLPTPGIVRLAARALVGEAGAIVVDRCFDGTVSRVERRLAKFGFRLVDAPYAELDVESFDLMLRPPRILIDGAAAARLDATYLRGKEEVELDGRRFPVLHVLSSAREGELSGSREGSGAALAALARMVGDNQRFTASDLEALARFMKTGVVTTLYDLPDAQLVNLCRALS